MTPRTAFVTAGAVAALLLLGACGSDTDSEGGASESSTTEATASTTSSTAESTTTTRAATDEGADLVGTWTVSAGDILAANTANLGGTGAMTCDGTITMTFAENGTLSRAGNVACGMGPIQGDGTISTTAEYAVTAPGELTISSTVTLGVLQLGGQEIPFPDGFGDGSATYSVAGGTLTLTFAEGSVGQVTQTYARA
jgi:hypothetical protein